MFFGGMLESSTGGAPAMTYLLRASFTAGDGGFTGAQGVENGSGSVVTTDGALAIASNKLAYTGQTTPTWGDLGIKWNQIASPSGKALFTTINQADYTKQIMFGWTNNGLALANMMSGFQLQTDKKLDFVSNGVVTGTNLVTLTDSQDAIIVLVSGGFDVNGVHWDNTKDIADYTYGCFAYWYNGSNYQLVWVSNAIASESKQYPVFSVYDASGTLDNKLVLDYDASAVMQPLVLDQFIDTNGTSLADHTPDVAPVGSLWIAAAGEAKINSNRPYIFSLTSNQCNYIVETGESDVFIKAKQDDIIGCGQLITIRFTDLDNRWLVYRNSGNFIIYERNSGTTTQRASAAGANTSDVPVKVIANGQVITAWCNNASMITYASATLNQTVTKHGFGGDTATGTSAILVDNFAVWSLTSAVYDSEFGRCSDYGY